MIFQCSVSHIYTIMTTVSSGGTYEQHYLYCLSGGTVACMGLNSPQGPQASQLVSRIYGRETRVPRGAQQVDHQRQSGLVWDFFPFAPAFFSSRFLTTLALFLFLLLPLPSPPTSSFTLVVSIREVQCVRYTPRIWDPHSHQSMLNGPLYFFFIIRKCLPYNYGISVFTFFLKSTCFAPVMQIMRLILISMTCDDFLRYQRLTFLGRTLHPSFVV